MRCQHVQTLTSTFTLKPDPMTLRLGTSFPPFSIHILTRTCPQQLQSHLHNSHVGTASLRNQPLHRVILTVPSAPCDPLPSAPWILTIPSAPCDSLPSAPCDPHQNTTSAPGDPHHTLSLIQTTFPHRATIHTLPGATTTIIAAFTFLTYAA